MNEHKISFIICSNEGNYLRECKQYIAELNVPEGFSTEILPIIGASSMASGYQQAMLSTDAKYKVYLHQDVFILNRNFIQDSLKIFGSHEKIGMIGMVGTKRLPENGCMWTTPMRTGALRSSVLNTIDDYFDLPVSASKGYAPVQAVDGLLIMTSYDLPWREDLELGWDFYDISQSLEFAKQGYRIVVPYQETPWVLHDNGFLHLSGYHQARKNFLSAYFPEHKQQIADCEQKIKIAAKKQKALNTALPIKSRVLSLFMNGNYDPAIEILQKHLEQYQEDEEYCILCIIAKILEQEQNAGNNNNVLTSFLRAENKFASGENFPSVSSENHMAFILKHYHQIRFCLWRLQYLASTESEQEAQQILQQYTLSPPALTCFQELAGCPDIRDRI